MNTRTALQEHPGARAPGVAALLVVFILSAPWAHAGEPPLAPLDLDALSLEELMSIEITSVSKKAQPMSEAAAAVYVITRDDIRRSGATSIADALRLAPGLQVARIDNHKWAITSRGFNGEFANKLLVLIDGRSVYTPTFSGVFWDIQDVVLADVERIEVIRGPGATLWGANAVNGVINVLTRSAHDTPGTFLNLGAGTEERGFGAFRHGGRLGSAADFRVYGKYVDRDPLAQLDRETADERWDMAHLGFRLDGEAPEAGAWTVHGDLYRGDVAASSPMPSLYPPYLTTSADPTRVTGGNILARYARDLSATADFSMQAYYDQSDRSSAYLTERRHTVDLDLQHRFRPRDHLEIVWGLGYRVSSDRGDSASLARPDPLTRSDRLPSGFLQAETDLWGRRLRLTAGTKLEHNDYTGSEYQPNARLSWLPNERHAVWAAVARAVRTPSRFEHDVRVPFMAYPPGSPQNPYPLPVLAVAYGDQGFESEILTAHEAGYRVVPGARTSLDLAIFYNDYRNLRGGSAGAAVLDTVPVYHMVVPYIANNDLEAETYGAELACDWQPLDALRLRASYTHLRMGLRTLPGSTAESLGGEEGASPEHQASLRASWDLADVMHADVWLRYVDVLPALDVARYVELDARLGWRPRPALELAVVGQNLLAAEHGEYLAEIGGELVAVQRGVYLCARWDF